MWLTIVPEEYYLQTNKRTFVTRSKPRKDVGREFIMEYFPCSFVNKTATPLFFSLRVWSQQCHNSWFWCVWPSGEIFELKAELNSDKKEKKKEAVKKVIASMTVGKDVRWAKLNKDFFTYAK